MNRSGFLGLFAASLLAATALACSSEDASDPQGQDTPTPERGPIGKADSYGSCAAASGDHCNGQSDGNCWCDASCLEYGDCCEDRDAVCGEPCTAQFTWLQKDAYKEEAGRTADFWPPHTTTVMTVTCGGEKVAEAIMKNHGTGPEAVDAEGTPILVEVKTEEAQGDRAQLVALASALESCECGTEFLSLDALQGTAVQEMLGELTDYIAQNLTCPGEGGTDALIQTLVDGDFATFLGNAPTCSWTSGADWETGLNAAVQHLADQAQKKLADYHVCNNDAVLQADLWQSFKTSGQAGTCDPSSPVCAGPKWLYTP
jgi:hypothetical protein